MELTNQPNAVTEDGRSFRKMPKHAPRELSQTDFQRILSPVKTSMRRTEARVTEEKRGVMEEGKKEEQCTHATPEDPNQPTTSTLPTCYSNYNLQDSEESHHTKGSLMKKPQEEENKITWKQVCECG